MAKLSNEVDEILQQLETLRLDLMRLRNHLRATEENADDASESVIMVHESPTQTTPFIC